MRYTQAQLERLLGIGRWWNIQQAANRLGNISYDNLRNLLLTFPRGFNGIQLLYTKEYGDDFEFRFVGTPEQHAKRVLHARLSEKYGHG